MSDFRIHTKESAPEETRKMLEMTEGRFGFLPNLMAIMAGSPGLLEGYMTVHKLLNTKTAFSEQEIQVLALTISSENGCGYCVAAHSWRAGKSAVDEPVIEAIRDGLPLPDGKLAALSDFARAVVRKRGWIEEDDIAPFLGAGYERDQIFDVVLAVAWKTMSNYLNHVAQTPLDDAFEPLRWERAEVA